MSGGIGHVGLSVMESQVGKVLVGGRIPVGVSSGTTHTWRQDTSRGVLRYDTHLAAGYQ